MDIIYTEKTWATYFWAKYNGRKDLWCKGDVPEELKEGEWYLVEKVTQGRSLTEFFIRELPRYRGINSVCFDYDMDTYFTFGFSGNYIPKKGECLKNFHRKKPNDKEWEHVETTSEIEDVTKIGNFYRVKTKDSFYMI